MCFHWTRRVWIENVADEPVYLCKLHIVWKQWKRSFSLEFFSRNALLIPENNFDLSRDDLEILPGDSGSSIVSSCTMLAVTISLVVPVQSMLILLKLAAPMNELSPESSWRKCYFSWHFGCSSVTKIQRRFVDRHNYQEMNQMLLLVQSGRDDPPRLQRLKCLPIPSSACLKKRIIIKHCQITSNELSSSSLMITSPIAIWI